MDVETGSGEPDRLPGLRAGSPGTERTHIEVNTRRRPFLQWFAQLGAVVMGIVIVLLVAQFIWGGGVDHESIDKRLDTLEAEARFQSCLLQFIPEERSERVIAECALPPTDTLAD